MGPGGMQPVLPNGMMMAMQAMRPSDHYPRQAGTCAWYTPKKKHGFITPDEVGAPDIFVHASDLGATELAEGDRVEYGVADFNGRPKAIDVIVTSAPVRAVNEHGVPTEDAAIAFEFDPAKRYLGRVLWYVAAKSMGFIKPDEDVGAPDLFVHASDLGELVLNEGDRVEYRIARFNKRPKAVEVIKLHEDNPPPRRDPFVSSAGWGEPPVPVERPLGDDGTSDSLVAALQAVGAELSDADSLALRREEVTLDLVTLLEEDDIADLGLEMDPERFRRAVQRIRFRGVVRGAPGVAPGFGSAVQSPHNGAQSPPFVPAAQQQHATAAQPWLEQHVGHAPSPTSVVRDA